jgi:uncharacterized protein YndB with AHSA1/START domain
MSRDIHYVMDLAAPRDRVWQAWTTSEGLAAWLCREATVEPAVGGRVLLSWDTGAVSCRVLSIDRPRLLLLGWPSDSGLAEVCLQLRPTLDGTRLELTLSGLESGAAHELADRTWQHGLERLRAVVRSASPP